MRPSRRTFRRALAAAFAATALTLGAYAAPASAAKVQYGIAPQTSLSQNDFDLMRQANVDTIRTLFAWQGIQAQAGDCTGTGGACAWGGIDVQVGAAASNGISTLAVIAGSAPFVSSNPSEAPTDKADRAAWADFAAAAVERYGPGGAYWNGPYQARFGAGAPVIPIDDWQLWNEQSSNQFFVPDPNAKLYGKMLKAASKRINAVHRGADIVLGGMFPDTGPKGIPIDKYLKQLYKVKKIEKTFDAVGVHPYSKKPKGIAGQMNRTRKAMDKAGDKKADIWVTELGYSSNGPNSAETGLKSEKKQAKALKQSFKLLEKGKRKYGLLGIVWFTWQDVDSANVCRFCRSAGLIEANGGQKPAYNAFQKATG